MGPDLAKLAAFYAELFGWNAKPATGMENYRVVDKSESGVGGAIGEGSPDLPSYEAITSRSMTSTRLSPSQRPTAAPR